MTGPPRQDITIGQYLEFPDPLVDVWNVIYSILTNFLSIYNDRWMVASVFLILLVGMFVHFAQNVYCPDWRRGVVAINIWITQCLIGYLSTYILVDHPHVGKFAVITGPSAIGLYFFLLWITGLTDKFGMIQVRAWLTLKHIKTAKDGKLSLINALKFTNKRGK